MKSYGKNQEEGDSAKTPITSKLGYVHSPDADLIQDNDYDYSETSKKRHFNPLCRRDSKAYEKQTKDIQYSSKDKRSFPPKSIKESLSKKPFEDYHRFDDQSFNNIKEDKREYAIII